EAISGGPDRILERGQAKSALSRGPLSARPHFCEASGHQLGRQELKISAEYYPDDVEANIKLGNLYLIAGRNQPDLFGEAQQIAGRALSKEPDNVAALVLSANAFALTKDYGSSVDVLEKAIALDPQNSTPRLSV